MKAQIWVEQHESIPWHHPDIQKWLDTVEIEKVGGESVFDWRERAHKLSTEIR